MWLEKKDSIWGQIEPYNIKVKKCDCNCRSVLIEAYSSKGWTLIQSNSKQQRVYRRASFDQRWSNNCIIVWVNWGQCLFTYNLARVYYCGMEWQLSMLAFTSQDECFSSFLSLFAVVVVVVYYLLSVLVSIFDNKAFNQACVNGVYSMNTNSYWLIVNKNQILNSMNWIMNNLT